MANSNDDVAEEPKSSVDGANYVILESDQLQNQDLEMQNVGLVSNEKANSPTECINTDHIDDTENEIKDLSGEKDEVISNDSDYIRYNNSENGNFRIFTESEILSGEKKRSVGLNTKNSLNETKLIFDNNVEDIIDHGCEFSKNDIIVKDNDDHNDDGGNDLANHVSENDIIVEDNDDHDDDGGNDLADHISENKYGINVEDIDDHKNDGGNDLASHMSENKYGINVDDIDDHKDDGGNDLASHMSENRDDINVEDVDDHKNDGGNDLANHMSESVHIGLDPTDNVYKEIYSKSFDTENQKLRNISGNLKISLNVDANFGGECHVMDSHVPRFSLVDSLDDPDMPKVSPGQPKLGRAGISSHDQCGGELSSHDLVVGVRGVSMLGRSGVTSHCKLCADRSSVHSYQPISEVRPIFSTKCQTMSPILLIFFILMGVVPWMMAATVHPYSSAISDQQQGQWRAYVESGEALGDAKIVKMTFAKKVMFTRSSLPLGEGQNQILRGIYDLGLTWPEKWMFDCSTTDELRCKKMMEVADKGHTVAVDALLKPLHSMSTVCTRSAMEMGVKEAVIMAKLAKRMPFEQWKISAIGNHRDKRFLLTLLLLGVAALTVGSVGLTTVALVQTEVNKIQIRELEEKEVEVVSIIQGVEQNTEAMIKKLASGLDAETNRYLLKGQTDAAIRQADVWFNLVNDRLSSASDIATMTSLFRVLLPVYDDIMREHYALLGEEEQALTRLTLRQNTGVTSMVMYKGNKDCGSAKIVSEVIILCPIVEGLRYSQVNGSISAFKGSDPFKKDDVYWSNPYGIRAGRKELAVSVMDDVIGRKTVTSPGVELVYGNQSNALMDRLTYRGPEDTAISTCTRSKDRVIVETLELVNGHDYTVPVWCSVISGNLNISGIEFGWRDEGDENTDNDFISWETITSHGKTSLDDDITELEELQKRTEVLTGSLTTSTSGWISKSSLIGFGIILLAGITTILARTKSVREQLIRICRTVKEVKEVKAMTNDDKKTTTTTSPPSAPPSYQEVKKEDDEPPPPKMRMV